MNWTGGRLRRHSSNNNAGALTKAQKQHFAKSRSKTSKGTRQVSPFHIISQFEKPSNHATPEQRGVQDESRISGTRQKSTQQVRENIPWNVGHAMHGYPCNVPIH